MSLSDPRAERKTSRRALADEGAALVRRTHVRAPSPPQGDDHDEERRSQEERDRCGCQAEQALVENELAVSADDLPELRLTPRPSHA
jgi:hypothetical protein